MTNVPPFMGDFSDEDVAWAIEHGVRQNVPAGEAIIQEGVFPRNFYVILEGAFLVSSRELKLPRIRELGPGEIAGEVSYLTGVAPRGSVRALEDSVVLRIPREELDRKIAEDAGFAARFHKVVSEFAVDRLSAWLPGPPPPPPEELASLRVFELIEKMLREDLPGETPGTGRREDTRSRQPRPRTPEPSSSDPAGPVDAADPADAEDSDDPSGSADPADSG